MSILEVTRIKAIHDPWIPQTKSVRHLGQDSGYDSNLPSSTGNTFTRERLRKDKHPDGRSVSRHLQYSILFPKLCKLSTKGMTQKCWWRGRLQAAMTVGRDDPSKGPSYLKTSRVSDRSLLSNIRTPSPPVRKSPIADDGLVPNVTVGSTEVYPYFQIWRKERSLVKVGVGLARPPLHRTVHIDVREFSVTAGDSSSSDK
jgi:hypothetical protein